MSGSFEANNTESEANKDGQTKPRNGTGGFLNTIFSVVILLAVLWNWDGFWHSDINWLSGSQQKLFPVKFVEEQLKVSRITDNNKIIGQVEERFDAVVTQNQQLEDQTMAIQKRLNQYVNLENEKCRYYDTALRMLDHLSRKYSEQELKRVLSCTSAECEQILENRALAQKVCTTDSVSSNYGQ